MSTYPIPYAPRFPDEKGRPIPTAIRRLVNARDNNECQYCGATEMLTLDHVYPWANGGTHHPHNLVVACTVCNDIAGLRVFTEFSAKAAYIIQRRKQIGPEALETLYSDHSL